MNELFNACVSLLQWLAPLVGLTYQEINIWLFVIIQPALILLFFVLWFRAERSLQIANRVRDLKCSKLDS